MRRQRGARRALCAASVAALCPLPITGAGPALGTATAATPPPALQVLEQKMGELKITSLRFSLQTSVSVPHSERQLLKLLTLFGLNSRITGEATLAPPAANVSESLFGTRFIVRAVGETKYVYFAALARFDHGRPWVQLGKGGLAELFTANGHRPRADAKTTEPNVGEPKLVEPPFAALASTLAGAREVRELGPGTLDGQQVTSFLAILEPSQLESGTLASASRLRPPPKPPTPQPATGTLEVSLTESGVPLRTVIAVHDAKVTTTVTLELPAVNFPLVIEAPPAAQTIDSAMLRKLEKQSKAKKRKPRAGPKASK